MEEIVVESVEIDEKLSVEKVTVTELALEEVTVTELALEEVVVVLFVRATVVVVCCCCTQTYSSQKCSE